MLDGSVDHSRQRLQSLFWRSQLAWIVDASVKRKEAVCCNEALASNQKAGADGRLFDCCNG